MARETAQIERFRGARCSHFGVNTNEFEKPALTTSARPGESPLFVQAVPRRPYFNAYVALPYNDTTNFANTTDYHSGDS